MKIQLTDNEVSVLKQFQRDRKLSRRQYIKVTVLVALHEGMSIEQIRLVMGIDENTVYRHINAYRQKGLEAYMADSFVAYRGKLDTAQLSQLAAHLGQHVYATAQQVCDWMATAFGIHYTPTGVRPLLHRLGFRYKKTRAVPGKADGQAQRAFLEQTLPAIMEEVQQGRAEIYYADGAHPVHNTQQGNGWIRQGLSVRLPANTGRRRVNINAAINAMCPTQLVYDLPESIDAASTQRLCEQLLEAHPGKRVYVVVDNARYNRNRKLSEWLADKPLELVFLPPYSPNLNLIERLWRHMREKVLKWKYFGEFEGFREKIHRFVADLKPHEKALKSLMTMNFKTVDGYSFYSQTT